MSLELLPPPALEYPEVWPLAETMRDMGNNIVGTPTRPAYDAFEHLWRSVFPFDAKEKLMAMLTVYADESGNDGSSPIVAVAGYVSDVSRWEKFQQEWNRFTDEEGIELFHTADMLALKGEFTPERGWNDERVTRVMQRADAITRDHVLFGLVSYTDTQECEKYFPLKEPSGSRDKYEAEYFFAGVQLAWGISRWAEENDYSDPIDYVFECGAPGQNHLLKALNAGRKTDPLIGDVAFACKKRIKQLHPADKLAQQCRRVLVRHLNGQETSIIMERLIATRLGVAYRMDSENLPILRRFADANNYDQSATIALDTTEVATALAELRSILEISPELVDKVLGRLESLPEVFRIPLGSYATGGTSDYRVSLHLSDGFIDLLAAVRAQDALRRALAAPQ